MTSSCVTFSWMGNGGAHCSIESSCFHASHNAHWCLSSSVHIWSRAVRSTIPNWFCGILCWWYAQWNWQLQWTECLLEAYPECGSSPPAISFQVPNNPNGKSFPNHVDIQIEIQKPIRNTSLPHCFAAMLWVAIITIITDKSTNININ